MQKVPEKMKTKYLRVTMPDGSKWDVPTEVIAENRAVFYNRIPDSALYKKAFELTINDDGELRDWAENNMNWADVCKYAELAVPAPPPKIDFQHGWVNGEKEVVER